MDKIGKCVLWLTMAIFLAYGTSCWAGRPGKFATALKNNFCSGTSGAQWYGCYAYMYYRVDSNKNNETAKSYCHQYGCERQYKNPADVATCKTGCQKAYNADTR